EAEDLPVSGSAGLLFRNGVGIRMSAENQISRRERSNANKIARRLSILFNPLVIGVPVVLAIAIHEQGGIRLVDVPTAMLSIFVICIVPLIYVFALMKFGVFENFNVSDRRQRIYLFPVLLVCFFVTAWILYRKGDVSPLVIAMLGYGALNLLVCALVSIRFKISLHCAGLGGMVVGAWYAFGPVALVLGLGAMAQKIS
ncbi:hypothetical protein ACFL4G_12510, partial [Thermodesulfobacteriota bacterium]